MSTIKNARQLALLGLGGASSGKDPVSTAPASRPLASQPSSSPPPTRNEDVKSSEGPTCAGIALAIAPTRSEDHFSQPTPCPGPCAAASPVLVHSHAARGCDAASAGLPVEMEAGLRNATMPRNASGEPWMHLTDPTQKPVDNGPASNGWSAAPVAHARDVETVDMPLLSKTINDVSARHGAIDWRSDSSITWQADHLSALISKVENSGRDPLRMAETIMREDGISLAEIVSRGQPWLEERLRQGLHNRHTGEPRKIPEPDASARRVLYALNRLKEGNPDDPDLPEVDCKAKRGRRPGSALRPGLSTTTEGSLIARQADHLCALIAQAKKGDRDPLTIAETIMRVENLSLDEIVNRGQPWLAGRLRDGLPHRHTGDLRKVPDPDARARRVLYALDRLKEGSPDDPQLPEVDCKPADSKLPLMALDQEPPLAKQDIRRWGELSKQERGRETGEGRALDDDTRHTYAYNVRLGIAAANQFGLVDEFFSVKTLGLKKVACKVLALLDSLFAPDIVAAITASLLRMNVDLFLMDPEHTANIEYLQTEAARRFPDLGLSAAACLRFEDLLDDELKMKSIMDAPKDIMERAYAPSLRPSDRVARASKAVVLQLKLESPGLDATQAAALDADVHLRRVDGVLQLQLPDPRERGAFRWDPCTPAAEELVTKWLEVKDRYEIGGSMFFPSEEDSAEPQIPRVAMAGIYREFMAVTGTYLTFDEIKTLRCYKAVKAHPTKLRQIAEAACHKDPRSLARRLQILLSLPQGRKAA